MDKEKHQIAYNKDFFVVTANELVRSKQPELTLLEAKLVRLLVMQVVKEDKDFRTYACKITDLADYLGIAADNMYATMHTLCKNLRDKSFDFLGNGVVAKREDDWKVFGWLDTAEYSAKTGVLTLCLSGGLRPYLLELNEYFTMYKHGEILTLSTVYAIRFYELICSFSDMIFNGKEPFNFSISFLREFFNCEEKYPNAGDFLIKVVDSSIKEVNAKTSTTVTYARIKDGRKIAGITVAVENNLSVLFSRIDANVPSRASKAEVTANA